MINFCMCVYNEAEFIRDRLEELTPHGRVIVVDGPFKGFAEPGYSNDGTIEACLEYDVTLITCREWSTERDKRSAYLKFGEPGDWVFVIDADEKIIDPESIEGKLSLLGTGHKVLRVSFIQPNGARMWPPRIYLWKPNLNYQEHGPIWVGKRPPWKFQEVASGVEIQHLSREDGGEREKMKEKYRAYAEERGIR